MLTMLGTTSSLIGMVLLMSTHYTLAVLLLAISGICDAFDGTLARKHEYSKAEHTYGVQLDSLSDVICFGVFPALITLTICDSTIAKIICVFYVLCGLIRLAYFNTLSVTGEGKKDTFIGMPITTVSIVYPIVFIILRLINFELLPKIMPLVLLLLGVSFIVKIEIPKVNVPKILKKCLNKYVINFLIFPLFIIVSGDLFYRLIDNSILDAIKYTVTSFFHYALVIILLIAVLDIVFLILNAIFKNSKRAKITILVIAVILMAINDIKYNIMGVPLEIADINYLNPDSMGMMGNATTSIGYWLIYTIIKTVAVIGIGLVFILRDKHESIVIEGKCKRIATTIGGLVILTAFILISHYSENFIIKKLYRTNTYNLSGYLSIHEMYNEFGFYPGVYINELYNNKNEPEGYETNVVTDLLNDVPEEEKKWGKANVVFILSESFSNLENIDEIKFDKPLTPNINSYMNSKNKDVFDLLVPAYGGASVNTEFEILTGASLSFWKSGFIPYTQYYNNVNGKQAPNIIKEFNNNGYETVYLTPWGENSYKSKYVYGLFGADETIYGSELKGQEKGRYYSDKSLMENIYEELENTEKGKYKFIMSATAQNHFPYNEDLYPKYDVNVKETVYSGEDVTILRNYAQGVFDADKELNNLYNKIQELDTPTIIVFYGDHLPYTVDSKGEDPYINSSYFNTLDPDLNELRMKTTKGVILSNYNIETEDLEYINASYLGAYIINKLDLEISDYFKFINNTRKIVPVFNRKNVYLDDVYDYDELDEKVKDALKNYEYVQYANFYERFK